MRDVAYRFHAYFEMTAQRGPDDSPEKFRKRFLVPQAVKRTVGVAANLLWDNAAYVLGADNKGKPERLAEQTQAFKQDIVNLRLEDEPRVEAVLRFLDSGEEKDKAKAAAAQWPEILEKGANLAFRLAGREGLVCQGEKARAAPAKRAEGEEGVETATCLVSGE